MKYDLTIIGAGTAGLSAAIYGVRAGLKTICIESYVHGGQIINTPDVTNYPAIEIISGADFANQLYSHAVGLGAEVKYEQIEQIDLGAYPKTIKTSSNTYEAKTVIIANGARHKNLDCKGEEEFIGSGVSYCAACDGNFFKGKVISIVGGGNTALGDALYLSNTSKEVHLIHRSDIFKANKPLVDRAREKNNIKIHLNKQVVEIKGNDTVEEIILKDVKENNLTSLKTDGVFIAIGSKPNNDIFKKWVDLDENGYIISDEHCATKTKGVYVAGDTRRKSVRQLITAAADGAVAATQAIDYILMEKLL